MSVFSFHRLYKSWKNAIGKKTDTGKTYFKILSIDGGGIRGIIPCQILAEMENELIKEHGKDARLCDYFDLIAGTSTGGIIAIGIALGIRAQDMLELYQNNGNEIFPPSNQNILKKLFNVLRGKPFYDTARLKELLEETYRKTNINSVRLGHAKTRLIIPTYSLVDQEIRIWKTSHSPGLQWDYQLPAVDVALSTAAAPIYFSPHDFKFNFLGKEGDVTIMKMIDGGIVANNPAFIALMEATMCLNKPLEDIALLSLGTGESKMDSGKSSSKISPMFWLNPKKGIRIYQVMAQAQAAQVDNLLNLYNRGLAGANKNIFTYMRLQHQFQLSEKIDMDSTSKYNIDLMRQVGERIYRQNCDRLKKFFLTEKKQEFTPDHTF